MLNDEEFISEYHILVQNEFDRLMSAEICQIDAEKKIEFRWSTLKESMTKAPEEVLSKCNK